MLRRTIVDGAKPGDVRMAWYTFLVATWMRTRALERSLARLPERERQILLLTARDGLSYPEVADRLGVSPETVEADLARALASLAQTLEA